MSELCGLRADKYLCDNKGYTTDFAHRNASFGDNRKIRHSSLDTMSDCMKETMSSRQRGNFDDLDISTIHDKSKRNSFHTDLKDDVIKSNNPISTSSQRKRTISIYDMGTALLAGSGLFHSWMLCLPMLIIVQSSYYNFIRLLLSTMFVLYFTKWSPYYKIYQYIHWIFTLLRYKRVERYCDKCERHLLQQLNASIVLARQSEQSYGSKKSSPIHDTEKKDAQSNDVTRNELSSNSVDEKTLNNPDHMKLAKSPQKIGWRLRSWRRFPWRVFSRNWGKVANTKFYPNFINTFLIWWYANGFGCNLEEAENPWKKYETLGHFFTRKLKPGLRPICPVAQLVSPADGSLTHYGQFKGGFLEQVKGSHYSINYFLGLQKTVKGNLNSSEAIDTSHASVSEKVLTSSLLHKKDGSTVLMQMIVYLSPGDYHRFHSPADWTVNYRRHFPGELLSVKPSIAGYFPGLFHLNERVCWFGQWKHGFFSMTAVAATNVGDIVEDGYQTDDDEHDSMGDSLKTNQAYGLKRDCTFMGTCAQVGKKILYYSQKDFAKPRHYKKGDAFGHFNFGSTIVLLFEAPKDEAKTFPRKISEKIKVGEAIYM